MSSCYYHKSGAKIVIIFVPTKCFEEKIEVLKNIFLQVIETKSLKALLILADKMPAQNLREIKMKKGMGKMDRREDEEQRIKSDLSLVIGELWFGWGLRDSNPVFAELKEASLEFGAEEEKTFHFEWRIIDCDISHIYVTNKANGHRYHISVVYPAALYVDVYRIREDGTEEEVFILYL